MNLAAFLPSLVIKRFNECIEEAGKGLPFLSSYADFAYIYCYFGVVIDAIDSAVGFETDLNQA